MFAWGDRYIGDLLNAVVPSVLAPGNLPFLAKLFDCDIVFLSEQRKFEEIKDHPAFVRLGSTCPTHLVSLDDLVVGPWYGISLTFALHRGIADLGPAMVDTFCIFLNADFILADGAFGSLAAKMTAGERLIVAPGYCAITEAVAPILRQRRDNVLMELKIPPRELAALALRHRHYTVRAKTVNQQVFRTEHFDQFYWYVDDDTLLARHLPIAVICMKPQHYIAEMRTFWDYGLVSEACPDVVPCVLSDSDDFMMLELRDEKTYVDQISLGWPSIQEIADDLSSFTTKDHRDYGRFTLVLHAADLPSGLEAEIAQLDAFMRDLYARMTPTPVEYVGHLYWASSIDEFKRLSAAYLREQADRNDLGAIAGSRTPPPAFPAETQVRWLDLQRLRSTLRAIAQRIYSSLFGSLPTVTPNHPYWPDLNLASRLLQQARARPGAKILIVKSQQNVFKRLVDGGSVQEEPTGLTDMLLPSPPERGAQVREVADWGGVRLTADLWSQDGSSEEVPRQLGSLLLTSDSPMLVHVNPESGMNRVLTASSVVLTPGDLGAAEPKGTAGGSGPYDLCLCDLSYEEFVYFRQIYNSIRSRMRPGATVLALFLNRDYKCLDAKDGLLIKNAFPLTDVSRVRFQGSWMTRLLRKLFDRGVLLTGALTLRGRLTAPVLLLASCAVAAIVNRLAASRDGARFATHASSVMLELTVKRAADAASR
jgi:hypothetical protein